MDYLSKEWWVNELNKILSGSDYEAIINPTTNENNVVVIHKGETKSHYIGVKPYSGNKGYMVFLKKDLYLKTKNYYNIPEPSSKKHEIPHFYKLYDPDIVFCFAETLAGNNQWIPSLDEYDPKISKEKWLEFLKNPEMFFESCRYMFQGMVKLDGVASCIQLEEKFGKTSDHYKMTAYHMAQRALRYFECPIYTNNKGESELFSIMFFKKKASREERGRIVWKMRPPLMEAFKEYEFDEGDVVAVDPIEYTYDKNLILYGPPGTGKTYKTAIYTVAICDSSSLEDVEAENYSDVMKRFNELKKEGRTAFTTFHQSYGYEEFIEGIKPVIDEENTELSYSIESGLFKKFCENAGRKFVVSDTGMPDMSHARVWALMLGGTGDTELKRKCFEENCVRIGWPEFDEIITNETKGLSDEYRKDLLYFQDEMNIGDIVITIGNLKNCDGVAVITGEQEHDTDEDFPRKRPVKWLMKGDFIPIKPLNGDKQFARNVVYPLYRITPSDILSEVSIKDQKMMIEKENRPFVFIIDEINRGNISKIFGELITLIEDTKREGMPEGVSAVLPYSGELFSVPENVYIIGTMNTADRSIALMDTALRRRFHFKEMMPDTKILADLGADMVEDIDIVRMLDKMNERITYLYDREHTIGHAFFTALSENPSIEKLADIFSMAVIPLLQEYFYEDYQKIQLVLGDNAKTDSRYKFIKDEPVSFRNVFKGNVDDVIDLPEKKYVINTEALYEAQSYKEIYE